jgi:hypothetical protein
MTRIREAESPAGLPLEELIGFTQQGDRSPSPVERRRKPRVMEPFPARILRIDSSDLPANVNCTLDNISSNGLYLRMPALLETGSSVRVVVHLWNSVDTGATVALDGHVLRSELRADGQHGVAITIERHRFL